MEQYKRHRHELCCLLSRVEKAVSKSSGSHILFRQPSDKFYGSGRNCLIPRYHHCRTAGWLRRLTQRIQQRTGFHVELEER